MNLLASIHRKWNESLLASVVPGGLHQDFMMEDNESLPYGVVEDVGGTKFECSDDNDDAPEDQTTRFWLFDIDSDRGYRAAEKVAKEFDDAVLTLDGGRLAAASRTGPIRFVTQEDLVKPVAYPYQIALDYDWQM